VVFCLKLLKNHYILRCVDIPSTFLIVAGVAAVASVASAVFCGISTPARLRRIVNQLGDDVAECERTLNSHAATLTAGLQSIETVYQAVQDDLEAAEKKRRQAAASASKKKNSEPQQDWNDPQYLAAVARQRGYDV